MKALWAAGQATVQDIRSRLLPDRPLAYTTVMTVMDRLARKGLVAREKKGRAHLYSPAVSEEAIRERALTHLINDFFRGTHAELRQYLDEVAGGSSSTAAPVRRRATKTRQGPVRAPREKEIDARMDASLL